jgi:hypothetical protein
MSPQQPRTIGTAHLSCARPAPEVPHESIADETDLDPEVGDRIEGHPRPGFCTGRISPVTCGKAASV